VLLGGATKQNGDMVRKGLTDCIGCGKSSKTASGYCGECFHANVNNIKTEYNRKRWLNDQAKISCWKSRGAHCSETDLQEFKAQKVCQICGKQETPLHFDHCHVTGLYRGALCKQCNVALGKLGDNLDTVIDRLYKYKNQFNERTSSG
jgi:hypothetical protein